MTNETAPPQTITSDDAAADLISRGHHPRDVLTLIGALIDAGLEIDDQPDTGWLLTAGEVDLLVEQLDLHPRFVDTPAGKALGKALAAAARVNAASPGAGWWTADGRKWDPALTRPTAEHEWTTQAELDREGVETDTKTT